MNDELRVLVDMRDRVLQKTRIMFGNRLDAIHRGDDEASEREIRLLQGWYERFLYLEEEADGQITELAAEYEIIGHMVQVKGVGKMLAAIVVSMVDIGRASTVSALWRYAGYAVINGARERPVKGEKLAYNKRLKAACYKVGSSFLKSNSPYRKVYDDARVYYEANRPDWTKGHQHNAAMRKMIKMWLSHLWVTWRQIEGLDVRAPYVHEKMGHNHQYAPEAFGWPEIAVRIE